MIPLLVWCGLVLFGFAAEGDLARPVFEELQLGEIKPGGWLEDQLRIQAAGLTGHLDEFWPDVRDSGWTGGQAEGWERLPYWLDGLVPLAVLLDDPALLAKSRKTIDYILLHQADDGWLGPEQSAKGNYQRRDPWPVYVILKVLTQYFSATGDPRVPVAIERFLRVLDSEIDQRPLFEWNRMRWQDGVLTVHWLFERSGASWLLALAAKMQEQGYDWSAHFRDLPHQEKVERWEHESHVVNNAMGVKAPALRYRNTGDDAARQIALDSVSVLDQFHGQAAGIFSGDECFAGKMPSQGTETCAVVEYLFSLEKLMALFGQPALGDRLEVVAFNALPAAFKPDMWARQYVQQANQPIAKMAQDRIYTTNGPAANVYGLETNYGCCTANLHQGWPKFAAHLWMKDPAGLAAIAYAPSSVSTKVNGTPVWIDLATDYPFEEQLRFEVRVERPVEFSLKLRVPAWTEKPVLKLAGQSLNLERGTFFELQRKWEGTTTFEMNLPMPTLIERRYNNAAAVRRGPLVYSLLIREKWVRVAGELPHADFEVYPASPWNYALELNEKSPETSVLFQSEPVHGNPFDPMTTPVRATVRGKLLPEWTLERNAAAPPPVSPVQSDEPLQPLTLIPYGAAKLRITEFPTLY
ncbi:MAG: glycoside hydrolase family 127 protein [Acidobacteriota bacterium]|nr:MAG: glycoside hydrolase family 127 protein [Acidobacteriota bacterium]